MMLCTVIAVPNGFLSFSSVFRKNHSFDLVQKFWKTCNVCKFCCEVMLVLQEIELKHFD